jgi:hypothetical protein
MKRFGPGWAALMIAMPMFQDPADPGNPNPGGAKDAAYWESEAKRAFSARDEHKGKLKKLEEDGLVITAEQKQRLADLEKAAADAEEEKKRKTGEFEAWRKDITSKHQTEIQKATERATALENEIANDKIAAAFGAATDYFGGGEKSKTILTPSLACKTFREHVSYEEYDFGEEEGGKRKTLVVRDVRGKIIRGEGGHPAPFAEAIGKLIDTHPEKDHILRGSGKAGSGARGGGGGSNGKAIDFSNLTQEQMRDPAVIAESKRRTAAAGGIVMGDAWERASAAGKK